MKKSSLKRKVLVISLAVALIAIVSMGSLAWFSATDTVNNEFKVAIDGDGDPDFDIDLIEHKPDPDDPSGPSGEIVGEGDDPDGIEYEDIAPGDLYSKDPTVKNTGSYSAWIRVKVTFDQYSKWQTALGNHPDMAQDPAAILKTVDETVWERAENVVDEDADTVTFVFYKRTALAPDEEATLFTQVEIPAAFTQEDLVFTDGTFTIAVTADAIQEKNTGATAQEAFALID